MMKRTLTFIACVAVCCVMAVSCKNAKTAEPTPEEIQAQKVALADSVLAEIDAIAEDYSVAVENGFHIQGLELTEQEKIVKPDYLLDPAEANNLVTKSQKINALAIYVLELGVREIYGMPLEEAKEAITKLAAEVNFHFDLDAYEANIPLSERIKMDYEKCVENGDQASFWMFQNAVVCETSYILAQNPELFFSKITDEQWTSYNKTWHDKLDAMNILARYDEEIASALESRKKTVISSSSEEIEKANSSKESAKQFRIAKKEKFIDRRNALLQ